MFNFFRFGWELFSGNFLVEFLRLSYYSFEFDPCEFVRFSYCNFLSMISCVPILFLFLSVNKCCKLALRLFLKTFQGTDAQTSYTEYIEPAFISNRPLYVLQPKCMSDSTISVDIEVSGIRLQQGMEPFYLFKKPASLFR